MKKYIALIIIIFFYCGAVSAQTLTPVKINETTDVRNQDKSGTCWCFSILSVLESELMKQGINHPDLSEMFVVRNVYIDKAKNYLLRQGYTRMGEGAFGQDLFQSIQKHGIVPMDVFPNSKDGSINQIGFDDFLKKFLDSVLAQTPIAPGWEENYVRLLDEKIGKPPESFSYEGKTYTPKQFADEVLKYKEEDFIAMTSFTHHPFYKSFNLEVPDNYSGGQFYNVPVEELRKIAEDAVLAGYTVGWDADVSNGFFNMGEGIAMVPDGKTNLKGNLNPDDKEINCTQDYRQELFENLTTQDDHMMQITGLKKSPDGKIFFLVKNSWGKIGKLAGFINVSETYFDVNTVSLLLPKSALSDEMKSKLKL
ncbi:MAG TPA: C1 family peptidase [Ignavibacteria bacterium]|nr:C1 family peptidase [Ignavibacteria bacterium]